jgi:hypothetical protein
MMNVQLDKTYKTISGNPVKLYHIYEEHKNWKIHGAIYKQVNITNNYEWCIASWDIDGKWTQGTLLDHNLVEIV